MNNPRADRPTSLTIRGLAERLGVAPMSLYRHVRDKEDLLGEVVDVLLDGLWQPAVPESNARAWIAEASDRLRRFLVEQPAALHVYLRRPLVSPVALVRMDALLRVLRRICRTDQDAQAAYAAIHTDTVGFAALEAAPAGRRPDRGPSRTTGAIVGRLHISRPVRARPCLPARRYRAPGEGQLIN